jgi:hypothetical protein
MNYPNRLIQRGEANPTLVRAIQQALNYKGCGPLTVDGIFELKTLAAVKLFQARYTDLAGQPLKIDGILGAITWAALFQTASTTQTLKAPNVLLEKALDVAISQVGKMESPVGSNWGKQVSEYLKSVGLYRPNAWCMAFVYWCYEQAAKDLGRPNPLVRTGGVIGGWNHSKAKKIHTKEAVENPSLVLPGQIFIISIGRGLGHTGIIEHVKGGILTTIEGNTNEGGSREGTGVFRRTSRKIKDINRGFLQYA